MNLMLLAAGEGTRLRPYTLIRPKPAMPFLNIPLATYPLAFLDGVRIDRLVVNTFHLPTLVVDLFIHMKHGARKLHFSHEIEQLLDTGGGIGQTREYFVGQGDFIMMNADEVILPFQEKVAARALEFHQKNKAICTILTMDHPDVGTRFGGVWLDEDERVRGFAKGKNPPTPECKRAEHYIGMLILSDRIFEYIPHNVPSNILYDAVTKAIATGHLVQRYKVDCHWFETGSPQDFLSATESCLTLLRDQPDSFPAQYLKNILHKYSKSPPVMELTKERMILRDPLVEVPRDVVSGFGVFGQHCRIPKNCSLHNVILGDRVCVAEDSRLENQILLEDN